jgi:hypothetical protein
MATSLTASLVGINTGRLKAEGIITPAEPEMLGYVRCMV